MFKSAMSNVYAKKLSKAIPIVYSIKKFATNFQANHVLGAFAEYGSPKNYYAFWSGTDSSTGYGDTDFETFLSASNGPQIQTITDIDTSVAGLPTLFETSIVDAIGPSGSTEKILRFHTKVKSIALGDPAPAQSWYMATRYGAPGNPAPALNEYYYSIHFKLDPILLTVMKDTVTDARGLQYMAIAEMKTGGYLGDSSAGDYRYKILLVCISPNNFVFDAIGDNVANGLGIVPGVDVYNTNNPYWRQQTQPGVPKFNEWCKLEIYIKRPSSYTDLSTGITWMAVTPSSTGKRQVICNKIGSVQMGVAGLPPARMFFCGQYSGLPAPIVSDFAQMEMHNAFPFGAGVRSINNIMYDIVV